MRCVTFNIQHGAAGLDRVASLLRDLTPDLVMLQEVDRGCRRSGGVDQAQVLGNALRMHFAFAEAFPFDGGSYGLALLSRQPIAHVRRHGLPHDGPRQNDGRGEPRILVLGETAGMFVGCTHLGLDEAERVRQATTLIEHLPSSRPVVLGGDFNEGPSSKAIRVIETRLRDAFVEGHGVETPTSPEDRPCGRIDFIWRSVTAAIARAATVGPDGFSDHRPVIVDFAD